MVFPQNSAMQCNFWVRIAAAVALKKKEKTPSILFSSSFFHLYRLCFRRKCYKHILGTGLLFDHWIKKPSNIILKKYILPTTLLFYVFCLYLFITFSMFLTNTMYLNTLDVPNTYFDDFIDLQIYIPSYF